MIGAIGLAMGALSTVSSLVDEAASSISKAADAAPAQSFSVPRAPAAKTTSPAALNPGVPIPKFDKRAHAHLLTLQEQLRRV